MPRIDDTLLECVVYLYPSVADAQEGRRAGGCGFWVVLPGRVANFHHPYIVTNGHVVRSSMGNSRVIRVNRLDGGFDIVETTEEGWVYHDNLDDVATYKLDPAVFWRLKGVPPSLFVTADLIKEINIGPGDDVVIVGRFISHDGKQTNTPAIRFGNIAMMPLEPVRTGAGLLQESFLVESRSLGGASGSPVFVRIPFELMGRSGVEKQEKAGLYFLGVNWGHLNLIDKDFEYVRDSAGDMHPDKWRVRVNTGMMGVVPAWKVMELLNQPEVKALRDEDEIKKGEELTRLLFEDMVGTLDISDDQKRDMREKHQQGSADVQQRIRDFYKTMKDD